MKNQKIGAVFLARCADGIDPLRRFAASYRLNPAGIEHELVVIFKGYEDPPQLALAQAVLDGLPHVAVHVRDVGFDIGAYLETCRRIDHGFVTFLNTHSEIVAANWLNSLFRAASQPDVGIAGAMGSYESIRNTVQLLRAAIWRSIGTGQWHDWGLAHYFDFTLARYHPSWYGPDGGALPSPSQSPGILRRLFERLAKARRRSWFEESGTTAIWAGAPSFDYLQFPGFPNPHIRTNGFMMRREQFLSLGDRRIEEKFDTNLFESGPQSLTSRITSSGMRAVVVGANGTGLDIDDWWMGNTFRLHDQRDLLVSDNHTRAFAAMSAGARATHARCTWGDYLGAAPDDFPDLGVAFSRAVAPVQIRSNHS